MSVSDTPETDAVNATGTGYATRFYAMKTLARKLERERDHSRRMQKNLADTIKLLATQRDAAIEQLRLDESSGRH